jgi:hypothetical protein
MGCSVAGYMRCEREWRTDSRRRTCVAPESAPARTERKVRGSPNSSMLSSGADLEDKGVGGREADSNRVGVNGESEKKT